MIDEFEMYISTLGVWGPCCGYLDEDDTCTCPSCLHQDKLKKEGKDYEEEYQKWIISRWGK